MTIRIAIAEDDPLLRRFLVNVLSTDESVEIVGEVGSGSEVMALVERTGPQILLLDLTMPGTSGLDVLELLREHPRPPRVLVLSGDETEEVQLEAVRRGACGFLPKSGAMPHLGEALRVIAGGRAWLPISILNALIREHAGLLREARERSGPGGGLTERERAILQGLVRGMTNQQMAEELFVSVSTVRADLRSIFKKLKVPTRTEAALFAVRHGIVDPERLPG